MLTGAQKTLLLDLARSSVAARVSGGGVAAVPADLEMPVATGVFVTIKLHGELRGCLGTLENRRGLTQEVIRCAGDSATEDPRFSALSIDELPDVHLELSVLGPLQRIEPAPNAFTVGVHGLLVEQGAKRGLLLPQVATEWGWTPEQFLRQTCIKAGLPADAWQRGAELYRFSAEVFGD